MCAPNTLLTVVACFHGAGDNSEVE